MDVKLQAFKLKTGAVLNADTDDEVLQENQAQLCEFALLAAVIGIMVTFHYEYLAIRLSLFYCFSNIELDCVSC